MNQDTLEKMAKIVERDAYMVNRDSFFIWCKHCRAGYSLQGAELNLNQRMSFDIPPNSYVIHKDGCIVVEAKSILEQL